MTVGFSGEVAQYYAKFRRASREPALDFLREYFGLSQDDIGLDLGCGTGQLTIPLASRVRSIIGMDPEPDMLHLARKARAEAGITTPRGCSEGTPTSPPSQSYWGTRHPSQ